MPRPGLLLALTLLPHAALAAWPEDVTLSGMTEHDGVPVLDGTVLAADYEQLVRELAAGIGTATVLPAHTLGAKGFEIALETNLAFTDVYRETANVPTAWERAHEGEAPGPLMFTPGLLVRKGLPFGFELGFRGQWVGGSRQGIVGGYVRGSLVEGFKPWPDLNVHLGYTAYVGNDELDLGVFDAGMTLGSRFQVGGATLKSGQVSPYLDITLQVVNVGPTIDADTANAIGAVSYGADSVDPDTLPAEGAIATGRFSGGLEVTAAAFVLRLSGGYTLGGLGNVAVAVGLQY